MGKKYLKNNWYCRAGKVKSLSKSYYKNSDGVLFVFDFNDEESFENIRNWISLFNENHNEKKVFLYI